MKTDVELFMDRTFYGWTVNFCTSRLWQFGGGYDIDDLLQESWIVFSNVCDKYPVVAGSSHLMALYKISLTRRFIDLKRLRSVWGDVGVEPIVTERGTEVEAVTLIAGPGLLEIEFRALVQTASFEVRNVLNLLLSCPAEELALRRRVVKPNAPRLAKRSKKVRETSLQRFARVLGGVEFLPALEGLKVMLRGGA